MHRMAELLSDYSVWDVVVLFAGQSAEIPLNWGAEGQEGPVSATGEPTLQQYFIVIRPHTYSYCPFNLFAKWCAMTMQRYACRALQDNALCRQGSTANAPGCARCHVIAQPCPGADAHRSRDRCCRPGCQPTATDTRQGVAGMMRHYPHPPISAAHVIKQPQDPCALLQVCRLPSYACRLLR